MAEASTWMPLYIGDYLADTMHLSGAEHGAYLLLIMHYWRTGPLLDDDKSLAAIARIDRKQWMSEIGPVVRNFFQLDGSRLHHKRIDAELAKAVQNSTKRREAANARWDKLKCKTDANASGVDVVGTSKTDDPRARLPSPSPSPIDSSSLRSDAPVVELDPGKALFGEGLETLARLAGKPADKVRGFLGKCRNAMKDDAGLLELIRTAERELIVDPLAWLTATVKCRSGPPLLAAIDDPWGIRAWSSRQADAKLETDARTGKQVLAINGYLIEASADVVAEAAGLPESWRGNWDALGGWMRADIELTAEVLAAVSGHAGRLASISSIAVFDSTVRSVRRAA